MNDQNAHKNYIVISFSDYTTVSCCLFHCGTYATRISKIEKRSLGKRFISEYFHPKVHFRNRLDRYNE